MECEDCQEIQEFKQLKAGSHISWFFKQPFYTELPTKDVFLDLTNTFDGVFTVYNYDIFNSFLIHNS